MAVVTAPGDAYRNLANAVVLQAVLDYEYLISDRPVFDARNINKFEIRKFAQEQTFSGTDVNAILDRIDRVYKKEFRPYVRRHHKEIVAITEKAEKHRDSWKWLQDHSPYHCPLCGGTLRRGSKRDRCRDYIVCSSCNLNMRIPKEE